MRLVTPDVKELRSPSTRLENPCTLVTIEAAKVAPGTLTVERPPEGALTVGPTGTCVPAGR